MKRESIGACVAIVGAAALFGLAAPAHGQYFATPADPDSARPAPIPSSGPVLIDPALVETMRSQVNMPDGFELTLFAGPPVAMYPVCVAEGADAAIYVCVDPNSSLSRIPGIGRVMRLVDEDNNGKADRYTTFAEMDSPRGIASDGETIYVTHPPSLTAYRDTDGDGIADWSRELVTGLGFGLDFRGADHGTNGIAMGIDGWIYIAVGDYGFERAVGTDGTAISRRGGAVVRVRPDGTNLEIYATGTRNTYDLAIDPFMNLFLRDNTDDGGGWDTRLHYLPARAFAGFPTHYRNFASEHFPYLDGYGSGSGVGAVWIQDPAWPEPFRNTLLTADWTVNKVLRHPLSPRGSIFDVEQHDFITMVRPTDVALDARSNLYASSLSGGQYRYVADAVGYVFRVTPAGAATEAPDVWSMTDVELVEVLRSANAIHRMHAQQELLRRGESDALLRDLERLIRDTAASAESRVAAMFTLKQVIGSRTNPVLAETVSATDARVRASALRALTDRKDQLDGVDRALVVQALSDPDDHVKVQALNGLVRLGAIDAAPAILPLTASPDQGLAHLAVDAIVRLGAAEAALDAVDSGTPELRAGALRALAQMHRPSTVRALLDRVDRAGDDPGLRLDLLRALARLYNREAPWAGDWWATRPSNLGPYYAPAAWEASPWIRPVLRQALLRADGDELEALADAFVLNRVLPQGAQPLLVALGADRDPAFEAVVDALVGRSAVGAEHMPVLVQVSEKGEHLELPVVELLVSQTEETQAMIPLLGAAALDADLPDEVRSRALNALGRVPDTEGTQAAAAIFAQVNPQVGAEVDTPVDDAWRRWVGSNRRDRELGFFIELVDAGEPRERALAYAVLLQRARGNVEDSVRSAVDPVLDAASADPGRAPLLAEAVGIMRVEAEYEDRLQNVTVGTYAHAQTPDAGATGPAGQQLYSDYCAVCHQPSGLGDGESFPPLAGSEWVAGSGGRLIRILLQGATGPIMVAGTEYDGAMPGLGTALDDAEIAAVVTYIRGAWGNTAAPVEPEEVAAVRAAIADRTAMWIARELLAVPGIE